MSNPRSRGCLIFAIMVVVGVVFCGLFPFVIMPSWGIGMALPVIAVPGEVVVEKGLFGIDLTNTLIGTILADIMVLLFALAAWRASRGWTKEIPGRFQSLAETIVEGFYGFLRGIGGERLRTTPFLWPLVATIFLFLLAGNLLKLFPGVETIGKIHCAHVGINGYPVTKSGGTYLLFVDSALNSGTPQTEESEHACHEFFEEHAWDRLNVAPDAEIGGVIDELDAQRISLEEQIAAAATDADAEALEHDLEIVNERIENAEHIEELEASVASLESRIATLKAHAADAHGAEADHGDASEEAVEEVTEDADAVPNEEAVTGEEAVEEVEEEGAEAVAIAQAAGDPDAELIALEAELAEQQTALNLAHSQLQYPEASLALSEEQLARGAIPYIFHITPYVRGPATDLSLTIALAIMSVVLVQVYGVYALGPAYFEKFINVTALGNLGKKPMGAIDFLVGLIEIISEIGKIVSLAFRLFGNLFAGGVALMAISFLVALLVPGVIYGLELIIGAVQALVFSVLTLVFSVQAMEAHHGDDHGPEHEHVHPAEHASDVHP
jgi:F0F1-type ATP synthase membrane subunit a